MDGAVMVNPLQIKGLMVIMGACTMRLKADTKIPARPPSEFLKNDLERHGRQTVALQVNVFANSDLPAKPFATFLHYI
jgi:hypothetical protein